MRGKYYRLHYFLWLLVILAACSSPVTPTMVLDVNQALVGQTVTANLQHLDGSTASVEVGEASAQVTKRKAEEVSFVVPDVAFGNYVVSLKAGGQTVEAKLDIVETIFIEECEPNDAKETACEIALDVGYRGRIDPQNDVDNYVITLKEPSTLIVNLETVPDDLAMNVRLLKRIDTAGTEVSGETSFGQKGETRRLETDVEAGSYYVVIEAKGVSEDAYTFMLSLELAARASSAMAISPDGKYVVGMNHYPVPQAFIWSKAAGMVGLGDLPGGSSYSKAAGVSANGMVVVGESSSGTQDTLEAFMWSKETGMVGLGDLPGGEVESSATAISADGSVIVGWSKSAKGREAFRWSKETGMVGLGVLGEGYGSTALGVSANGAAVVGWSRASSDLVETEAFLWTQEAGMIGLGDLPEGIDSSTATAISADGKVIVGHSSSGNNELEDSLEAFMWTQEAGMIGLGDLPGGDFDSRAYGVSADGSVVVGMSGSLQGNEAFRWSKETGMVGLGDLPPGEYYSKAYGVSAKGLEVTGTSDSAEGSEAFIWSQEKGMSGLGFLPTGTSIKLGN